MIRVTAEPMWAVYERVSAALAACAPGERVWIEAPDPDLSAAHFDGEPLRLDGAPVRYRSLAAWLDLAEALGASLGTPQISAPGWVRLPLRRLDRRVGWHRTARPSGDPEKYGADSEFARTDKFEDPAFVRAWRDALAFLQLPPDARVLSLGCHTGGELGAIAQGRTPAALAALTLVGVDHAASAIAAARARYPQPPFTFQVADLNDPAALPPGRFDLVIAINLLQSQALDGRALFRRIVGQHLAETGGVLLGFPNSRVVDHRVCHGAAARHVAHPELSGLLTDLAYHRRYLHQHRCRTIVTGKHTVLLAGRRLARTDGEAAGGRGGPAAPPAGERGGPG